MQIRDSQVVRYALPGIETSQQMEISFRSVNFLHKRRNYYCIFRQLGGGKECLLCLLALHIVLMPKWHIWGWHILFLFSFLCCWLFSPLHVQPELKSRNASCLLGQGLLEQHCSVLFYSLSNPRHLFFSYL